MARTKKTMKAKEPIKIRFKKLANGNQSVYLDIYKDGARYYEFLKLYIVPEVDAATKEQNKNTMQVVNAIKSQKIIALANSQGGIKKAEKKSQMLLVDWLDIYILRKREQGQSDKNARNLKSLKNHIVIYSGEKEKMCDVTKQWCLGFIKYLSKAKALNRSIKPKTLNKSTADMYFTGLSCVLDAAVKDEIIEANPIKKISTEEKKPIKPEENTRTYLTIEEVKALINTDIKNKVIKNAFLFGCFCGLRISDIRNLVWGDIHTDSNGQITISKTMLKTGRVINLPLSNEAVKWMPKRENKGENDFIFDNIPTANTIAYTIKKWAKLANVEKDICFHVSRHSFATLSLTAGADLYTTSKLLGHRKITTTQIYAEIVNKKKTEAVNAISNLFD